MPRIARKPPRSRLKTFLLGCGIGCGTGLVALLIVAALFYARLTAVPRSFPHAAGPSPEVASPQPAPANPHQSPPPLDEQLCEVRRAAQSGQSVRISLRVDETRINEAIAQAGGAGGQLRDPHVTVRDHDLLATGIVNWGGREFYATVVVTPQASNGEIRLRIDSFRAGTQELPGFAVSRLQAELDKALAASPSIDERVHVDDVAVTGGEVVISAQTVTP